jgi:hypothetical protein
VAAPVNVHAVDRSVGRCSAVAGADQIYVPIPGRGPFEDLVQMQLGATAEGVVDISPVDRQDLQDAASGLRAITPIVGVV